MGWDITFAQLPVLRSGHRHTLIMGQQPLSQIRNRTSAATCVYFTGGILAPPHVDGLAISYPVKLAWRTRTEPRHSRRKQPSSTSGNTARPASWLVNSFSSGFGPAHARLPHQGRKQKARRRMLPPDAMNSLRCRHQQISSLPVGQRVAGWLAVPRAAGIASCWFQLILTYRISYCHLISLAGDDDLAVPSHVHLIGPFRTAVFVPSRSVSRCRRAIGAARTRSSALTFPTGGFHVNLTREKLVGSGGARAQKGRRRARRPLLRGRTGRVS
jgi:hypothetical protein